MGDRSKSVVFSLLVAYLDERGVDLSLEGSAQSGLHMQEAVSFVELLSQNGLRVLGIEPWRRVSGHYRIESLGVWASDSADPEACNSKAKQVLEGLCLGAHDVVTIQF
jgi:hypothetical protein